MTRIIRLLALLLGAQLLLAFGLSFTGPDLSPANMDQPLLALDAAKVDRIVIEGPDQAKVVLARQGDGWVLPESGDFPADAGRVEQFLRRLAALKPGQPVATSKEALARFRVNDDTFERRIALGSGGKETATLYLGSSPARRLIHARLAGRDAVYGVEFFALEAPASGDLWQDKGVLRMPPEKITAVEAGGLKLERAVQAAKDGQPGSGWKAEGLAEGETLSAQAADKLALLLADLRIGGVLGTEAQPQYGLDQPELVLALVRDDGSRVEYALGKMRPGPNFVLKTSGRPEYLTVPEGLGNGLVAAAKREALLGGAPKAETQAGEGAAKQ